jgi:RND family efflux transporter MFP subunit
MVGRLLDNEKRFASRPNFRSHLGLQRIMEAAKPNPPALMQFATMSRPGRSKALLSTSLLLLAFALLVQGCSSNEGEGDQPAAASQQKAAQVTAEEVVEDNLSITQRFFAQVRSRETAALSPSAPGEVISVAVREGDAVEQGDVLLRVNSRAASANLQQLRAQLSATRVDLGQAQRDAERARRLAERSIGSEQAAEQAEAQASQLREQIGSIEASIAAQQQTVSDHVVEAPFDGIITDRQVDVGDFVQPGAMVLELVATDELEVFVRLPQSMLDRLDQVDNATLEYEDKTISAEVEGVVSVLEPSTRSALVRLIPDDKPSWLRPGATIDVVFELQSDEIGLIVPLDAVVYGVARPRVVVAEAGKARPVNVHIVETSEDRALVRGEGLAVGDKVVTRGNERLRPNQPLTVVDSLEQRAAAGDSSESRAADAPSSDTNAEPAAQGDATGARTGDGSPVQGEETQ